MRESGDGEGKEGQRVETETYAFGFSVDASDRFYNFILSLLDINQLEEEEELEE